MGFSVRHKKTVTLTVADKAYVVEVLEIPFREGVEVRTMAGGKELRVSDRGLGEGEALRLLEEEIKALG